MTMKGQETKLTDGLHQIKKTSTEQKKSSTKRKGNLQNDCQTFKEE